MQQEFSTLENEMKKTATQLANTNNDTEKGKLAKMISGNISDLSVISKSIASIVGDYQDQKKVLNGSKNVSIRAQQLVLAAKKGNKNEKSNLIQQIEEFKKELNPVCEKFLSTFKKIQTAKSQIEKSSSSFLNSNFQTTKESVTVNEIVDCFKFVSKCVSDLAYSVEVDSIPFLLESLDYLVQSNTDMLVKSKTFLLSLNNKNSLQENQEKISSVSLSLVQFLGALSSLVQKREFSIAQQLSLANETVTEKITMAVKSLSNIPGQEKFKLEENFLGQNVLNSLNSSVSSIQKAVNSISVPSSDNSSFQQVSSILSQASKTILTSTESLLNASIANQKELLEKAKNPRFNVFAKGKRTKTKIKIIIKIVFKILNGPKI